MPVTYRPLDKLSIEQIRTIDRHEEINEVYVYEGGIVQLRNEYHHVTDFDPEELKQIMTRQYTLLHEGGVVVGAWLDDVLIGVASVERKRRAMHHVYHKMDILYVSAPFRGGGIGRQLLEQIKAQACQWGAERLYISATPTRNTVDFYLSQGAMLAQEVDKELFTLEPNDIHLEMRL